MPKFRELQGCAEWHLDAYCNNRGQRYAWVTYDGPGDPSILSPADVLATGFVNVPIGKRHVWEMFGSDNEYTALRMRLQDFLDRTTYDSPTLAELVPEGPGAWTALEAAMVATDSAARFTPTIVSKILHRKRPHLVPMMDKHVFDFYAIGAKDWRMALLAIQEDLRANTGLLDDLRRPYESLDGRPMTRLRALDIVVWHHAFAAHQWAKVSRQSPSP